MARVRLSVLAPLVVIPAATMGVLIVDGTAFEPEQPALPDTPCPASATSGQGRYPTDLTEDARTYAGQGPHRVFTESLVSGSLPARWRAAEPAAAELVLCEYEEGTGEWLEECAFVSGDTVMLEGSRVTYRLYAARTSERVAGFQLEGSLGCPFSVRYPAGGSPPLSVLEDIDPDEVVDRLRPYVEGGGSIPESAGSAADQMERVVP